MVMLLLVPPPTQTVFGPRILAWFVNNSHLGRSAFASYLIEALGVLHVSIS